MSAATRQRRKSNARPSNMIHQCRDDLMPRTSGQGCHSWRKATIGSTRIARRAGAHEAASTTFVSRAAVNK